MGGIDLDLQGHLAISTHKMAFNVALVHWSRPAKGCYTSQTCSCYPLAFQAEGLLSLSASVRPSVHVSVRPWTLLCPQDNSSHIWARIIKFVTNMHPGIFSTGIENKGHWPWPSRSFWPFWLRILENSACPQNNLSQIWDGITKFAPNMHIRIFLSGIENEGHWSWSSRSFWLFWLRILGNLICRVN